MSPSVQRPMVVPDRASARRLDSAIAHILVYNDDVWRRCTPAVWGRGREPRGMEAMDMRKCSERESRLSALPARGPRMMGRMTMGGAMTTMPGATCVLVAVGSGVGSAGQNYCAID